MKAIAAILLVATVFAGCLGSTQTLRMPVRVRVGLAVPSYVHGVAWVAKERGFTANEGLIPDIQVLGGSAATVQALVANVIDVGIAGGDAVIKANAAGADLVIIAGLVNRFYHRLIARSDIHSVRDLRGKRIGVPFLGGPQEMTVRYVVRAAEMNPNQDIELVNMGKEMNALAALQRGEIDATTSDAPAAVVAELGLVVVADAPAWDVAFPYAVVVVRRSALVTDRPMLSGFLKSLTRAIAFYRDPAHRVDSLAILGQHLTAGADDAHREASYRGSVALLSDPPYPAIDGLAAVMDEIDPGASSGVGDLLDVSLLDELRIAGWFDARPQ